MLDCVRVFQAFPLSEWDSLIRPHLLSRFVWFRLGLKSGAREFLGGRCVCAGVSFHRMEENGLQWWI
jgi:hypothetical protein